MRKKHAEPNYPLKSRLRFRLTLINKHHPELQLHDSLDNKMVTSGKRRN
jgi:hypothetical protein